MRPSREVIVRYDTDRPLWHHRQLIEYCDAAVMSRVMGEAPDEPGSVIMWAMTPTGDIYPEELSVPPLLGIAPRDLAGTRIRDQCLGAPSHGGQVFESGQVLRPAQSERARAACRIQNL
ncbi:unnamed protein product [Prorocentrum cordatum]|uniref:Amine oxidase n=1 Tax=Prorocentrum cordatum TaxID=2364126 RepID=A0ABN9W509_9DINO|nr:unnamed protein product [Polarella glacialis]